MTMKVVGGSIALVSVSVIALWASFALAQTLDPTAAVGCVSEKGLWQFLDARDASDPAAVRQLFKGECRALNAIEYSVVEDRNGTVKILVFKKPGDWESAETLYTLDEMLDSKIARPLS
jgi:hypothetical protein